MDAPAYLSPRATRGRWARFDLPPGELAIHAVVPDGLLVAFLRGRTRSANGRCAGSKPPCIAKRRSRPGGRHSTRNAGSVKPERWRMGGACIAR